MAAMAFERFWRWYDRASRADFGGTLLGFVFDWKAWISAAVGGGGGAVTFLKAAIDGRSPLDVWVLALVVVASLIAIVYFAISILEKSKKSRQEGNSARDIVGDSATITAPVRPPTDQSFPFGLHISNIWIQRPYLAERSVIHINLDGFNGTGEDIFLKSIEGQIAIRTESLKPVGKLGRVVI